jgi:threonine dehydrogenase-like Zn-dependent dehydrogenase
MASHRAIVLSSTGTPLSLETVPTPDPAPGQLLLKVLAVPVLSFTREIVNGQLPYPLSLPFVPGISAIARIETVGSDTTSLTPGQLVFVDPTVRARDDSLGEKGTVILQGWFAGLTPEARRLADKDWRNGSWAEKLIVPLENVHAIDEDVLVKQKGYSYSLLTWINALLVPYGGWVAGNVCPGETVIVCFATGHFGAAAIHVALGLGVGRVVAVGRKIESLKAIQATYGEDRVSIVAIKGDADEDAKALRAATPQGAGADCFLDLSPPQASATASTHIQAALSALKSGGRAVLMGGVQGTVAIPYSDVMIRNLKISGRFMFEKDAPAKLIRLIERGNVSLEKLGVIEFGLDEIEKAIDEAGKKTGAVTLNLLK